MNAVRIFSVFMILLGFALTTAVLLGLLFQTPQGNIGVIKITGAITNTNNILSSGTNAQSVVDNIKEIKENPLIKSFIIDINSPGGSSVASAEVVRAIRESGKPCVALIRDVGASGAYWVASACDYIVAHPLSLVGSIGVSMDYLEFSGLFKKYNISYVNLSYPEHKDMFSQYRPLTDTEKSWAKEWLRTAYDYLVTDIASNRNMTKQELLPIANGSVFLGNQALSYGLIDKLGGWPEALNKSAELGNVTYPLTREFKGQTSLLSLMKELTGESRGISI